MTTLEAPNAHGIAEAELHTKITELAETLMAQHLDKPGWTFGFDRAVRRFGVCSYTKRHISVSLPLARTNPIETVRNTILHEIAHAIVGPGHDHVWRRTAVSIGCTGDRCSQGVDPGPEALPWLGTCPNGHTTRNARAPQRVTSCGKCSPMFAERYVYTWVGPNGQPRNRPPGQAPAPQATPTTGPGNLKGAGSAPNASGSRTSTLRFTGKSARTGSDARANAAEASDQTTANL